jgi:hypothetical protein
MKTVKKHRSEAALKVRVAELESRLDNLHRLVTDISYNQGMIIKALSLDAGNPEDEIEL